ncbi:single-stranded DNA-binding protein [Deltaproteobacteria bacterium TL4]
MGSLNKVMLIGNLGKDPEIRYTQSGNAVANFSIATTDIWKDKQGQRQEKTEWHTVVAWDRLADLAQSYLKKGKQVYIEGSLQTRSWEDQQGQKRYTTEIIAKTIQFLGVKEGPGSGYENQGYTAPAPQNPPQQQGVPTRQPSAPQYQTPPGDDNSTPDDEYIKDDIPF